MDQPVGMGMAKAAGEDGVRATLARSIRLRDVLLLSLVPAAAVAVFFLPAPVRRSLAFNYVEPTPFTAVTATYVHLTLEHLVPNLLAYVFVVGTGYVLALLAGRRRLFGTAALTYVLAVGPLLWALNLAVPRPAIGFGLSGLNMAFAGLLPILLVAFARRHLSHSIEARHAPIPFFVVLTGVALLAVPLTKVTVGIAVASGVLAVVYGVSLVTALRNDPPNAGQDTGKWLEIFVVAVVLTIGYPLLGFPAEPAVGGAVINLYVHFLGYGLAFMVPYIGVEAGLFD